MTDSEDDAVRLERDGDVGRIVLDRPERRNALSVAVTTGIVDAVRALEGSDVGCVVVEGEGPAFCAGGDLRRMAEYADTGAPLDDAVREIVNDIGRAVRVVAACEFPTVAKVDGPAFGAGAALALACDLQLLSEDASMGFGFRDVGLAVDSGTSYLLPRAVGDNVARELVFTGEQVDPDRAVELGLANHVYPDPEFEERTETLVSRIADGPAVALRTSKRLLRNGPERSLAAAIDAEAGAQAAVFDSADHAEGVAAFTEGREPEFTGE